MPPCGSTDPSWPSAAMVGGGQGADRVGGDAAWRGGSRGGASLASVPEAGVHLAASTSKVSVMRSNILSIFDLKRIFRPKIRERTDRRKFSYSFIDIVSFYTEPWTWNCDGISYSFAY